MEEKTTLLIIDCMIGLWSPVNSQRASAGKGCSSFLQFECRRRLHIQYILYMINTIKTSICLDMSESVGDVLSIQVERANAIILQTAQVGLDI